MLWNLNAQYVKENVPARVRKGVMLQESFEDSKDFFYLEDVLSAKCVDGSQWK